MGSYTYIQIIYLSVLFILSVVIAILYYINISPRASIIEKFENSDKTLILYCYYETPESKSNLEFFVKNGIIQSYKYNYVIIVNNSVCSVEFPEVNNLLVMKRSENQTDLQTYAWFIKDLESKHKQPLDIYKYIYFINSSCIGPFIPISSPVNWIEALNSTMNGYELIGPIIEFPADTKGFDALNIKSMQNIPYIHSYMFGTGKFGFSIVRDILLDLKDDVTKDYIVYNTERLITSKILTTGYKIKSLLLKYKNIDVNDNKLWDKSMSNGDPEVPEKYDGIDVNPLEVMFVKNIRNSNSTRLTEVSGISPILSKYIEKYKKWI